MILVTVGLVAAALALGRSAYLEFKYLIARKHGKPGDAIPKIVSLHCVDPPQTGAGG